MNQIGPFGVAFFPLDKNQMSNENVENSDEKQRQQARIIFPQTPKHLIDEAVFENTIDGAESIFPADFLAFFVGSAVV